jgi:hypothetical protein
VQSLVVLDDHSDLYRYMDLTAHSEALHRWLVHTIDNEMPAEVHFLDRYDRAIEALRMVRELRDADEQLFIKLVVQNNGRLSKTKRAHFADISDDVLARMQEAVRDAFNDS